MRNRDDIQAIADQLNAWRTERGWDIPDVHRELVIALQEEAPSVETVRLLHQAGIKNPQRTHLAMCASVYGHDPAELHEGTGKVLAFVGNGRWAARDSNPEPAGSMPERKAA